MKKLFLPLVLLLVTITTHAYYHLDANHGSNIAQRIALQTTSSGNYVVNGDCESDDVMCLWGQDGGVVDYQNGADTHFVEGAGYNGSRCVMVQSIADAQYEWDTQFFVYTPNRVWVEGDKFLFKMKARADIPTDIMAQAHRDPNNYLYWRVSSDFSGFYIDTEWQEFVFEVEVSSSQSGMQSIALILNSLREANKYYFDDISWELIESAPRLSCPDDKHPHMIDLGLPSGTKWACCNVGATTPEGYGGYYAWGETEEKALYNDETYKYSQNYEYVSLGSDIAGTSYDVAHVKWGGSWVMSSTDQNKELVENCTYEWTTLNGVTGGKFTSKVNGRTIFLPASGFLFENYSSVGSNGGHWSSTQDPSNSEFALTLHFDSDNAYGESNSMRSGGHTVRPVSTASFAPLQLSSNSHSMTLEDEGFVTITSGSGSYFVTSSDENVVSAMIDGNMVHIFPYALGTATITVTDAQSGETATIEVTVTAPSVTLCPDDNHPHMIDLGLPSGTKWACCNVGATTPEGYGGHYAWGETEEKTTYDWSTYIHCDGSEETCHDLGSDIAGTEYDVAHVKWGGSWVIPSLDQNKELIENCSSEWATVNGVNGRIFTGSNGSSIFLPAAGGRWGSSPAFVGNFGDYGSSTQYPSDSNRAYYLYFDSGLVDCWDHSERDGGQSVRPVSVKANSKVYHFDVNNDGEIVLTDALIIINYILGRFDSADQSIVYHFDVNNDGSIELTDALIIINYILGKFEPEGEWYMVAKTSDSDGELVPVREVGSLVAADDALDFTILGINGNVILEKVLRVDFKPEKDLNSSERLSVKKAVSKKPAKVKGVTKSAEGQSSFVVADKNGNNYMLQEVTFRHDKKGSSWMGDGQSGDIRNLQYIARTRTELATVSGEDVMRTLEALSGTGKADAEALAAAVKLNTHVEEANAEDGSNVVLKMKDSNRHVVYPLYDDASVFEDISTEMLSAAIKNIRKGRHLGSIYNGKVAIFNHFQGMSNYNNQNRIVNYIKVLFEKNGYDVEFYGKYSDPAHMGNVDYEQKFDRRNLAEVIKNSDEYKAIIIFSHGFEYNGKSYFATSEVIEEDPEAEYAIHYGFEKENGDYYIAMPVEGLTTDNSCITYLGSCCGAPKGGYGNGSFLDKKKSCFLVWNGKNRVAQADALILFYNMIYEGFSLKNAVLFGYTNDAWYAASKRLSYNTDNHNLAGEESLKPNYISGKSLKLMERNDFYQKTERETVIELKFETDGSWEGLSFVKIRLEPLLNPSSEPDYEEFNGPVWEGKFVSHITLGANLEENIYRIKAYYSLDNENWRPVRLTYPYAFIFSMKLSDNYALPVAHESDLKKPKVLDNNGTPVYEISIPAGSSQTYQIDAYPGHTLSTPCLDTNVVTVSLSGNTLTVTGVSEGSTGFGVYDKQNHKMAVVKVTVTKGGSQSSNLSCPDDHHPHMIDLGLPSGTKWACCNIGADKPEAYGEHYAWGETEEKSIFSEDTYSHYQNGSYIDLSSDIAGTQYDVAHMKWGGIWVMPSYDQHAELRDNCTSEWTTVNGVKGMVFTGSNGSSIFLPAAGLGVGYPGGVLYEVGIYGYYWSSTQNPSNPERAYNQYFFSGGTGGGSGSRISGQSVRPVSK